MVPSVCSRERMIPMIRTVHEVPAHNLPSGRRYSSTPQGCCRTWADISIFPCDRCSVPRNHLQSISSYLVGVRNTSPSSFHHFRRPIAHAPTTTIQPLPEHRFQTLSLPSMTSAWNTPRLRGLISGLIFLFSLSFLGVTGRHCAVSFCDARLAFLVASGAISLIFALSLAILFLIVPQIASKIEAIVATFLLFWWAATIAVLAVFMEKNFVVGILTSMTGFAWLCLTLAFALTFCAIGAGSLRHKKEDAAHELETPTGMEGMLAYGGEDSRERDAVREEDKMEGGTENQDYINDMMAMRAIPTGMQDAS